VPPAEEEGEGTVEEAVAAAKAPAEEPAAAEPKPGEPKPAAETPTAEAPPVDDAAAEEKDFASFLEKNKGKTPEELARYAYQQGKRANKEAATNRQVRDQVSALAERARRAAEARAEAQTTIPEMKQKFREKLATDPDAAVQELFDSIADEKLQRVDEAANVARVEEAIAFADTHIPEFGKQWSGMVSLAKEIGYSDAELDGIDDGRALVMLSLANHSARLMKAGVMDRSGNIVNVPTIEPTPLDPRLAAPDPQRTLGGTGARSARGAQTIEQQLAEIDNMSDAELAKFDKDNPGVIDGLLKQAAA
jgi:hypothetical protein